MVLKLKSYLWIILGLLLFGLAFAIPDAAAQSTPPNELVVQMNATTGKSLGVFSRLPSGWSEDHSNTLLPFGNYTGTNTGLDTYTRSYLWFPLPPTPAGYTLQAASVELYYLSDWPFTGTASFGLYRVTAGWDETMSWSTRAPLETGPLSTASLTSSGGSGWIRWDATAAVTGWLSGTPNEGLAVAALPAPDAPPAESGNWAAAAQGRIGSDPALAPRLVLHYAALPPTATATPVPQPTAAPPPQQPPAPAAPSPTPTATPIPPPLPLLPVTGGTLPLWLPGGLLCLLGAGLFVIGRSKKKRSA